MQIHTVVHRLGLVPVLSWQNMDMYGVYTQQINKLSDFKLFSDLLNIVLPIYISYKKAWVRVNQTHSWVQVPS